jgi:acetyl/propionyl-CoA carboxylase alpha subunit
MDSGVEEGSRVSGDYDPLLAKLLVVAPDREQAVARARRAIDELQVGGLQTTLPFHRWLLGHPAFVDADLRTDLVDRDWDPVHAREAAARKAVTAVARAIHDGADAADGRSGGQSSASCEAIDHWTLAARREATQRWPG